MNFCCHTCYSLANLLQIKIEPGDANEIWERFLYGLAREGLKPFDSRMLCCIDVQTTFSYDEFATGICSEIVVKRFHLGNELVGIMGKDLRGYSHVSLRRCRMAGAVTIALLSLCRNIPTDSTDASDSVSG